MNKTYRAYDPNEQFLLPVGVQEWLPADHLCELSELFVQVLSVCRKAGPVKLGHVSVDGTKMRANASKHKAMSYGRMLVAALDEEGNVFLGRERYERSSRKTQDLFRNLYMGGYWPETSSRCLGSWLERRLRLARM